MRKKPHYSGGRSGGNNNNNKRRFVRKGGSGSGGGGGARFGGDDSDFINPRMRKQAQTNRDKYLGLAKDALSSGDRVESEYYLQHADHYLRILNAIDAQFAPRQGQGTPERGEEGAAEADGMEEGDADAAYPAPHTSPVAQDDEEERDADAGSQLAAVLPAARTAGL